MSMRLYLTEQPALAEILQPFLIGPTKKRHNLYISDHTVIAYFPANLLLMCSPEEYDAQYSCWSLDDLPILPTAWRVKVNSHHEALFRTIQHLIVGADEIVHAGSPTREGQLVIDELLAFTDYKGKVLRLLLTDTERTHLVERLNHLPDNCDFKRVSDSALARKRADWLFGINLSRALTILSKSAGYTLPFMVGRLKAPILALVVRREIEIQQFKQKNYAELCLNFRHVNGALFSAVLKDNAMDYKEVDRLLCLFRSSEATPPPSLEKCEQHFCERKAPRPFSLLDLQIEAAKIYGYSPNLTQIVAQRLYSMRYITFPLTESHELPESRFGCAKIIFGNIMQSNNMQSWISQVDFSIKSAAWRDVNASSLHAIMPTTVKADLFTLNVMDRDIYLLIFHNFIGQFLKPHVASWQVFTIHFAGYVFEADMQSSCTDIQNLPTFTVGDPLSFEKCNVIWHKTLAPQRFSEVSLLEVVQNLHHFLKDPSKASMLRHLRTLGVANIVQSLIDEHFLILENMRLYPTTEAMELIRALPEEFTYPDELADWEAGLAAILDASSGVTVDTFVNGLGARLKSLLPKQADLFQPKYFCPICGAVLLRRFNTQQCFWWGCSAYPSCNFSVSDHNLSSVIGGLT